MDKVIDIEERIPSMREKRRRKTNKKFLFMLTVFVVALLAILYFQSPLSKVERLPLAVRFSMIRNFIKNKVV